MLTIVTGGQAGVDRAALDAAMSLGIPVAGWCPAGRAAEDGPIPEHYPLRETPSANTEQRTVRNVQQSDGLLVLNAGYESAGTNLAIRTARRLQYPVRLQSVRTGFDDTLAWLQLHLIKVLNVAGPRESQAPGLYTLAHVWMIRLLEAYLAARIRTS